MPYVITWGLSSSLDINSRSKNSISSLPIASKHIKLRACDFSWHKLTYTRLLISTLEQGIWAIRSRNHFSQPLVAKTHRCVNTNSCTSKKRSIPLEWFLKYYRWIHVPKLQGQALSLLFSFLSDQEQGEEMERSVFVEWQQQRVGGLAWEAGLEKMGKTVK